MERAIKPEQFVSQVVTAYKNGEGIFANKINAEELIPVNIDGLSKALYLFYVLQLDYAMRSQILYKGALKLYKALWLLGSEGKPKSREDILNLISINR